MEWLCCLSLPLSIPMIHWSHLHYPSSSVSPHFFCVCFFVYVVFVCCSCNVLLLIGDCLASYFEWNHEHIYFQENCIIYFIWRLRIFLWGFTSYSFIIFESETLFNIKFFIFCVSFGFETLSWELKNCVRSFSY